MIIISAITSLEATNNQCLARYANGIEEVTSINYGISNWANNKVVNE